ncbi:hypothetical protein KBC03_04510 [Patescibacteria group bacterium]|nr:hypothetical protein [Patescibacteria group bacterium]
MVNFLYFANAMSYHLFEKSRNEKEVAYKHALLHGDFLLADGIALQLWSKWSSGKRVHNLN